MKRAMRDDHIKESDCDGGFYLAIKKQRINR